MEYRQVVAESFARGGRRDDDDILSGMNGFRSGGLVRVKLADALGVVGSAEARV